MIAIEHTIERKQHLLWVSLEQTFVIITLITGSSEWKKEVVAD